MRVQTYIHIKTGFPTLVLLLLVFMSTCDEKKIPTPGE